MYALHVMITKDNIAQRFNNLRTGSLYGKPAKHKPLLLLVALARCVQGEPRLAVFAEWERLLLSAFSLFYTEALGRQNTHYPFGKLENDRLWEVENSSSLKRTSVGHLHRSELLTRSIQGGLVKEVFEICRQDHAFVERLVNSLLDKFFSTDLQGPIRDYFQFEITPFDLGQGQGQYPNSFVFYRSEGMTAQELKNTARISSGPNKVHNPFINYLNSLHNVRASGANALAESQALSRYFSELYEPFPVVKDVIDALNGPVDRVVVLTGHAGDGKSTVALDVLKQLRGLPSEEPLNAALEERECIRADRPGGRTIEVVKDMSELSGDRRMEWLRQAFGEPGSWLIVSNTGPLLNSLSEFAAERQAVGDLESRILKSLHLPYVEGELDRHTLSEFPKDLVIINITRLDNVTLSARILGRLIRHSGWEECNGCKISKACPIMLNRKALAEIEDTAEDRVRWVYRRLTAYEQRLTLRQMVAHLAFSLTGGMDCKEAVELVRASTSEGVDKGTVGLENILFSEAFFGYRKGQPCTEAGSLRAVELLRRQVFGGPIAVDFARGLGVGQGTDWARLPKALFFLSRRWASLARESVGVRWRFAQRRMIYLFGCAQDGKKDREQIFLDAFLQSPRLRDFDRWSSEERISINVLEQRRLRDACLRVLLELFSGFSAGQFPANHNRLFLTLRRPDRAVIQPTQLVMGTLYFDQFRLDYDRARRLPQLVFSTTDLRLDLTLPLLDFIEDRHRGELGGDLAQIHLAQLEWFGAELLRFAAKNSNNLEVSVLRATINGEVELSRYFVDEKTRRLEVYQ